VPIASVTLVLGIVVGVILVLMVLLFLGGLVASGRRRDALRGRLTAQIEAADAELAQARAGDRGWDRAIMEAAATEAYAAAHPGRAVTELHLVQVVDRPGTDADQAVFRALADDGAEETITLGRQGGAWVPVA
jgi:hypothetical protein